MMPAADAIANKKPPRPGIMHKPNPAAFYPQTTLIHAIYFPISASSADKVYLRHNSTPARPRAWRLPREKRPVLVARVPKGFIRQTRLNRWFSSGL
jgi:hypothetical protein